jgi:hypothetical protein
MSEFIQQDLSGSRFDQVHLAGADFHQVRLNGAHFRDVDLRDLDVRGAVLTGKLRGVEFWDVELSGEIGKLVVNGVEVGPYVEAELDRRMPERVLMRPTDPEGFRTGFATIERLWDGTVERARALPPEALHRSVDGEWSFIQTLRHLGFATACWMGMALGDPQAVAPVRPALERGPRLGRRALGPRDPAGPRRGAGCTGGASGAHPPRPGRADHR